MIVVTRYIITLIVHFCVQRDGRDAAHRPRLFAAAQTGLKQGAVRSTTDCRKQKNSREHGIRILYLINCGLDYDS